MTDELTLLWQTFHTCYTSHTAHALTDHPEDSRRLYLVPFKPVTAADDDLIEDPPAAGTPAAAAAPMGRRATGVKPK